MEELLVALGQPHGGVIPGAALRAIGYDSRRIERAIIEGRIVRIRHGAYAIGSVWRAARPAVKHRMLVIATVLVSTRPLIVSHLSAAALHGLPTIGPWPSRVHVLDRSRDGTGSSRYQANHRGPSPDDTVVIDGVEVTTLVRTLVDVAASEPLLRSVAALDAALHAALAAPRPHRMTLDRAILHAELDNLRPRRGYRAAERAIVFADARAESVGESLSRVRMYELGFVLPDLQVRFAGVNDGRDAVVDFFWKNLRLAGEFDGREKYTRGQDASAEATPGDIVWSEKRREDALRRTAVDSVARWGWSDAISPVAFSNLLRAYGVPMHRGAPRPRR
ncbi:MAG TPA: hypothetical protein VFU07_10685 [Candidatus Lumbricidophila sp.]|nr:hypothetical protein [Candidatus Lumbricidophila sp.]